MKRAGPTVHMIPRRICACCKLRKRFAVVLAAVASASNLAQMRLNKAAEIGQMRQLALAPQQKSAELLFELLDRASQRRL